MNYGFIKSGIDHRFGHCRGGLYALPLRAGINPAPTRPRFSKNGRTDDKCLKSMALRIVMIFIATGLMRPVFAHTVRAAEERPVTLDTIVVTGRDMDEAHQTGDVDREITPAFYTVIKKDAFEGRMQSVGEVIDKCSGIQVRKSGGEGGFSTVSIRGSSSDQVLVYLDGILLNDASGGGVDLSTIPLSDVASIEIYKGVTPAQFGDASIGGVVNIRTRRITRGFSGRISAGYGSFETRKLSGLINNKPGRLDYLVSGEYMDSDNDFRFKNDNGTPYNLTDDKWENRKNADFAQTDILSRIGFDFSGTHRIEFVNHWFSKNQGVPTWDNYPNRTSFDTRRNISTLKLIVNDLTRFHINSSIQLDFLDKKETYDDSRLPSGEIGLGRQYFKYQTYRYDTIFYAECAGEHNVINTTLKASLETYQPNNLLLNEKSGKNRRKSGSAVFQDTIFFLSDRLSIIPALRLQMISDLFSGDISGSLGSYGKKTYHKYDALPQVGVKYRVMPGIILKSNIGKYVRYPSFFELFGDRGVFAPNPALKPEKGMNFDCGIEYAHSPVYAGIDGINGGADFFFSRVDDLITRTYDARGIGKSVNISSAEIYGTELDAGLKLFGFLSVTGNATFQHTKNLNRDDPAQYNKDLPGRFTVSLSGRVEAIIRKWKFYLDYLHDDGMYYDSANLLDAGGSSRINCGISRIYKKIKATVEARNITSDRFEDFNGYPMPGRSFIASIRYEF